MEEPRAGHGRPRVDAPRVYLVHGRRVGSVPAHGTLDGTDRPRPRKGVSRNKSFGAAVTGAVNETEINW